MFDLTTNKGKIVAAAMKLANDRSWADISLREIAGEAGLSMVDLRSEVSSKAHIFGLFTSAVDKEVLRKAGALDPDQTARDNVFETIMNRFDVMEPYKPAIKSILQSLPPDPRLAQRLLASQGWMLEASGISSYGPLGGIKTVGLASVYMQVARIWLDDDDPGMAKTMAALDRRLRRGERTIQAISDSCNAVGRISSLWRNRTRKSRSRDDQPPPVDDDVMPNDMPADSGGDDGAQPSAT